MSAARKPTSNHIEWKLKRLHSFVGFVPLSIWVVAHFLRNVTSVTGPESFDGAIRESAADPLSSVWAILLVYLPLGFHALYGLWLTFFGTDGRTVLRNPNFQNIRWAFQRLSALGLLGFLFAHVFLTRVHGEMGWLIDPVTNPDGIASYAYFATHMTDWAKGTAIVYALGILATAYHLGNGLATFCISWGITTGARAQRTAEWVALVFGVALLVVGFATIAGFFMHSFEFFVTPGGPLSPEGFIGRQLGH